MSKQRRYRDRDDDWDDEPEKKGVSGTVIAVFGVLALASITVAVMAAAGGFRQRSGTTGQPAAMQQLPVPVVQGRRVDKPSDWKFVKPGDLVEFYGKIETNGTETGIFNGPTYIHIDLPNAKHGEMRTVTGTLVDHRVESGGDLQLHWATMRDCK